MYKLTLNLEFFKNKLMRMAWIIDSKFGKVYENATLSFSGAFLEKVL